MLLELKKSRVWLPRPGLLLPLASGPATFHPFCHRFFEYYSFHFFVQSPFWLSTILTCTETCPLPPWTKSNAVTIHSCGSGLCLYLCIFTEYVMLSIVLDIYLGFIIIYKWTNDSLMFMKISNPDFCSLIHHNEILWIVGAFADIFVRLCLDYFSWSDLLASSCRHYHIWSFKMQQRTSNYLH